LFRNVVWFRYDPEAECLHLEGDSGPLESFTGTQATEVWRRLLTWRNRYGVAPLPAGMNPPPDSRGRPLEWIDTNTAGPDSLYEVSG